MNSSFLSKRKKLYSLRKLRANHFGRDEVIDCSETILAWKENEGAQ